MVEMRKPGRKQLLAFLWWCNLYDFCFMRSWHWYLFRCFRFHSLPLASLSKASRCHTLWQRCTCRPPKASRLRGQLGNHPKQHRLGAHSQQAKATVQRRHEQIRKQLSAKKLEKGTIFYLKEKKVPKHGWSKVKLEFKLDLSSHSHLTFRSSLETNYHVDVTRILVQFFPFNHLTVCKGREGETMTHNNPMEPHIITS